MTRHDFKVERVSGRLVEATVFALSTLADVDRYGRAFADYAAAPKPFVLCADHRAVRIYPPDVADALIAMFSRFNRRWERAVLLAAPTNAIFTIQLQRVVRASNNESRGIVTDTRAAEAFLDDVLTPEERKRLRAFLEPQR